LINREFGIKVKYEWPREYEETTKNGTSSPKVNEVQLQDIKEDSTKQ
jgi:hypothetical protein